MRILFDQQADALYVEIKEGKFHSNRELDENTVLDLDREGNVLGFEIIGVQSLAKKGVLDVELEILKGKSGKPLIEKLEIPLSS
ncbi:MAG TPA: DUF2283 domain-containing protein [Candidatus Altiarchaeales archaeon]|nr:DUF2283 domain-containing protein [Candidatus Altiarchaeales archaeon]